MTELRKNLEGIQSKQDAGAAGESQSSHEEEIRSLREELDEANEGKEHFETQYKNLLGRVNTIKTSLGDRLKADAVRYHICHCIAAHARPRSLTSSRPVSKSSNRKSPTSRSRIANYRRITTVSPRSLRNYAKKKKPRHQRLKLCGAERTCRNRTGSKNAMS